MRFAWAEAIPRLPFRIDNRSVVAGVAFNGGVVHEELHANVFLFAAVETRRVDFLHATKANLLNSR